MLTKPSKILKIFFVLAILIIAINILALNITVNDLDTKVSKQEKQPSTDDELLNIDQLERFNKNLKKIKEDLEIEQKNKVR